MRASNTKENIDTARYDQETSSAAEESEMTTAQRSSAHSEEKKEMTLYPLLMDDSLLPRILGKLIDDGLHECRRVCRKWRDVCNALPVKLDVGNRQDIANVSQIFPNASSLTCQLHIDLEFALNHQEQIKMSEEHFLSSIAQMTKLRNLKIAAVNADWLKVPRNELPFVSLTGLQSLDVDRDIYTSPELMLDAVRALIGLTSLRLVSWVLSSVEAAPLTEIQKLNCLEISIQLFCDSEGRLLFPSISHLTHLGVTKHALLDYETESAPRILKKVLPLCGATVQSLKTFDTMGSISPDEWSVLLQFPKVEALAFQYIRENERVVLDVVKHMTYLIKLEMTCFDLPPEDIAHVLSSLDRLESLSCILPLSYRRDGTDISHMTQLTSLKLGDGIKLTPFRNLTGLVKLDLFLSSSVDLSEILSTMPLLESVKVVGLSNPRLEDPSVLRSLTRLKSLKLYARLEFGGDFFPALGSLPELTFLKLLYEDGHRHVSALRQISLLSHLRALDCTCLFYAKALDYLLDGCLPKLRWLAILWEALAEGDEKEEEDPTGDGIKELRRRLPCLNRILIEHD